MKRTLIFLALPAFVLAAWVFQKVDGEQIPLCAMKWATGIDCPGCGLTRSVVAFLQGDFRGSIDYHPMGLVFLFGLLYIWFRSVFVGTLFGYSGAVITPTVGRIIVTLFVAGLFLQWLIHIGIRIFY